MKKTILMSALAMVLAAQPALAAQFSFDFRTDVRGDIMRGSGTLDTEHTGDGRYRVTGATGTFFMWDEDEPCSVTGVFGEYVEATDTLLDAYVFDSGNGWATRAIAFDTKGAQDQTFRFERGDNGLYQFFVSEVGANNVAFDIRPVAAAVPEPATWALMLVGFGAVGAAMRRNRRVTTAVSFAA